MICSLCGPTEFEVTMRSFEFAGQVAYLVVCDTCRDKAAVDLAKRESRGSPRGQLDVDVKGYTLQPRADKGKKVPQRGRQVGARFRGRNDLKRR